VIWLISGSRAFPDEGLARAVFKSQFKRGDWVICGGARGVDTWAEEEARAAQATIKKFPADWRKNGKAAGPLRNEEMFSFVQDRAEEGHVVRALVLWDGESRGTKHMLGMIEEEGMPLTLVTAGYD
jgi:hypothetical protein